MKLSDLSTEKAADVLCEISVYLRTQLNDMMRETDDERVRDALRRAVSLMEN